MNHNELAKQIDAIKKDIRKKDIRGKSSFLTDKVYRPLGICTTKMRRC